MAEQQLVEFLDALLTQPPAPDCLLALLEQARPPMCYVEEELARRYQNKPLILADDEAAVFGRVVGVWKKMSQAYALCAVWSSPMPVIRIMPNWLPPSCTVASTTAGWSFLSISEHAGNCLPVRGAVCTAITARQNSGV